MELKGAVAAITGGGSGLGEGAARQLAAAESTVVIFDLPSSNGETVAKGLGENAHYVPCDVTNPTDVADGTQWIQDNFGRLDVCINAAGVPDSARMVSSERAPFPLDVYRRVIEINLIGTFDVMRQAAALMTFNDPGSDGERGVIINVSSGAAWQGQKGQAAYSASKAGVIGLMLPAARDLAEYGIRVVTIAPGLFQTGMMAALSEKVISRLEQMALYPRRPGDPDEFAALVCHVITNRYLNATTLSLDAGMRLA